MDKIIYGQYGERQSLDIAVWVGEDKWTLYVTLKNTFGETIPVPKDKIISIDGILYKEWELQRGNRIEM